jgi:hypothetical protein
LANRVPLKITYLIVRLVAALAVLVFRRDLAKEADLLVLGTRTGCCAAIS